MRTIDRMTAMRALRAGLVASMMGLGWGAGGAHAGLPRESGAIYLEDFLAPGEKAQLKVVHPAPIFYQSDGKRRLGTLVPGADAEILAVTERVYLVRTKATHAGVSGWVSPKALEPHNEVDFMRVIKELQQRKIVVDELIANKKVALGMTAREVKQSLGEPDRVSSTVDDKGRRETFEYVTYKRIPQITTAVDGYGRPFQTTTWIKVETGRTSIDFANNSVTSVQNTEGAPNLSSPVIITPPPILVF